MRQIVMLYRVLNSNSIYMMLILFLASLQLSLWSILAIGFGIELFGQCVYYYQRMQMQKIRQATNEFEAELAKAGITTPDQMRAYIIQRETKRGHNPGNER